MRMFDKLFGGPVGPQISDSPELSMVLCVDHMVEHAVEEWKSAIEEGANFTADRFPFCKPPWPVSFVEANVSGDVLPMPGLRQYGAFTISLSEPHKCSLGGIDNLLRDIKSAGGVEFFSSALVFNYKEKIILFPAQAIWGINENGSLALLKYCMANVYKNKYDDDGMQCLINSGNLFLETMLLSFTFANCSNVKLEDVTEDIQPEPKIRRRLKTPEVKRYTLNISGHVARPSRDYNEGTKGVMPFHLCRGHFATYTPSRPMFGNPKLVGRYWHPPHMKGKKENGEIVKDYAIKDSCRA